MTQQNPTFAYYFVFVNRTTKEFVDFQAIISDVQAHIQALSDYKQVPLESLFTEAHVFIRSKFAHQTIINRLLQDGFVDLDLQEELNAHNEFAMVRRTLAKRRGEYEGTGTCLDPYMAANVPLSTDKTIFYILDASHNLQQAVCLDDDAFDAYFGGPTERPQYSEEALDGLREAVEAMEEGEEKEEARAEATRLQSATIRCSSNIVYPCKEVQNTLKPIRRLPFSFPVYVFEEDIQAVVKRRGQYVLIPRKTRVGRIVSDCVRMGGDLVSAEHCQTDHKDRMYNILEFPTLVANAPNMLEALRSMFGAEENEQKGGGRLRRRGTRKKKHANKHTANKHTNKRKGRRH